MTYGDLYPLFLLHKRIALIRLLHQYQLSIMGVLLDSSWMRFGPAGKGSDDGVTRSPSIQEQQNLQWNEAESGEDTSLEFVVYAVLPAVSILLLALMAALVYRCCSRSKLSLANIVTLDLQDADSSAEFLASLTRNAERHASTTSNGSDRVFVMVYLSPPYDGTLSKITRAASLSSSKDVECVKIEDLEGKLFPDIKSSSH